MKVLPHELHGNKKSQQVLVFLHGWPDSIRLWDSVVENIDKENNFIICISYPNYHESEYIRMGHDFPDMAERIKFTIDQLLSENFGEKATSVKKMLIGHDWGAYFTYFVDQKYPKYFDSLITMDVSPSVPKFTLKQIGLILLYQMTCIFNLFLGMIFPSLASSIVRFVAVNVCNYPYNPKDIKAKMGFPYFYLHKNRLKTLLKLDKRYLSGYKPSIPLCYVYATDKGFQFQSKSWEKLMSEKPNELVPMSGGHWLQLLHGDKIAQLIARRAKL